MDVRLSLSLLTVYMTLYVHSFGNQWRAIVPARIPTVQGSCVVIPCTFTYPRPRVSDPTGFWYRGETIISTNIPTWKFTKEYKRRTKLLGNLGLGNCTMVMDSVKSTDTGPFYFRIELASYRKYSFKKQSVSVDVMRVPQPPSLTVTRTKNRVTASCSVSHSCIVSPPQLSWSRTGQVRKWSKKLNTWQWQMVSTLTFAPVSSDFRTPLNCTVKYKRGKQATNSTLIS